MNRPYKPAIFRLDDPAIVVTPAAEPRAVAPADSKVPVTEADAAPPAAPSNSRHVSRPGASYPAASRGASHLAASYLGAFGARRRMPWAGLFWVSAGGLTLLAMGLGIANLITDLLARSAFLGGVGAALAAVAAVALAVIATREALGLARLATIDQMRERAAAVLASDDRTAGRALGRDLIALTKRMPHLARGRARLEGHLGDIIDGADLVRLSERELMTPLDEEARRLIASAARRVSVVTAISPRAAVDMFFVLVTALGLMRRLALLYGGRPGALGMMKLMRHAISHIALTGGMAASDSLIQQMIGHGLAAKLSAKLGEGVLNGLLTARLGLAAMDETRPLPFTALRRPALNDLAGALLKGSDGGGDGKEALQDKRETPR
jgi:putative membrane protein